MDTFHAHLLNAFANWRLEFFRPIVDVDSATPQNYEEAIAMIPSLGQDVSRLLFGRNIDKMFAIKVAELFYDCVTLDVYSSVDLHKAIHTDIFDLGIFPHRFIRGVRVHRWSDEVNTLTGLAELERKTVFVVEVVVHLRGLRMVKNSIERYAKALFRLVDLGVEIRMIRRRTDGGAKEWPASELLKKNPTAGITWLFLGQVDVRLDRVKHAKILSDLGVEIIKTDLYMGYLIRRIQVGVPRQVENGGGLVR
ncbi:hypothetical protein CC80DRAFT_565211 [Byssothecium circinans]|uniref:Uncharacterized protein n=1 Tax=Byssothecium circinans TaxID=147558 RepID=A0A6A5UDE7_9PLEO|nr:hypothetical protein CC80DRAFT_565211 [Byssothecium circinans]